MLVVVTDAGDDRDAFGSVGGEVPVVVHDTGEERSARGSVGAANTVLNDVAVVVVNVGDIPRQESTVLAGGHNAEDPPALCGEPFELSLEPSSYSCLARAKLAWAFAILNLRPPHFVFVVESSRRAMLRR